MKSPLELRKTIFFNNLYRPRTIPDLWELEEVQVCNSTLPFATSPSLECYRQNCPTPLPTLSLGRREAHKTQNCPQIPARYRVAGQKRAWKGVHIILSSLRKILFSFTPPPPTAYLPCPHARGQGQIIWPDFKAGHVYLSCIPHLINSMPRFPAMHLKSLLTTLEIIIVFSDQVKIPENIST